jgi:hypothetical protein
MPIDERQPPAGINDRRHPAGNTLQNQQDRCATKSSMIEILRNRSFFEKYFETIWTNQ